MCLVLVSPLYLHIFWPFTSVLQNAKYRHLPSPILFNSFLPSAKSTWVNRRTRRVELLLGSQPQCCASAPARSLHQHSSHQHWRDPSFSKDWPKTRSPTCGTWSRNTLGVNRNPPWAGELGIIVSGPSCEFFRLALNVWAKKNKRVPEQKSTSWMSPA